MCNNQHVSIAAVALSVNKCSVFQPARSSAGAMAKLSRANPKIQTFLQEASFLIANRSSKAQIVSILEGVLELLKEDGMVSYLQIHPKKVGVHPRNRYGFGIQVNNVHRLGARIVSMGWSWEACSLAIAMRAGATSKIAESTVDLQT